MPNPKADGEAERTLLGPALLAFPERVSAVWHADPKAMDEATSAVQVVMFRLLMAVPPGRVRFTMIDPVGLGRHFGAFMQLADFEDSLVTQRVWSESAHLDARLAELMGHIETVQQKYLRDQFATIEDYNAQAGELAEPYRILVAAQFPAGFHSETAKRLLSIARAGPRCGVHVLVTLRSGEDLPQEFRLSELESHTVCFHHEETGWRWMDDTFGGFPFEFDMIPASSIVSRVLRLVGEEARRAKRIEVPFESIAPPPERWWSGSSRTKLEVPLGRSGATHLQRITLGEGTSQHALIAGKTGSGKSTLLHALVTNLALHYSPEEVELYLIDFKEGVEFKPYASFGLPHARVVAIESEREFGLSVLQRLEQELQTRGDRFRAAGVQDIRSYREVERGALPRILLIVDEFQVFFMEEDKISEEAALLLDRLVRQGRAFGIHVCLGSQTLGGAYSLARSTMGQMTVRIALECSETDAHLILGEDNPAARWLSRPGEAIYNEASGDPGANSLFQVVWISDQVRDGFLARLRALDQERNRESRVPAIVFEGRARAELGRNQPLGQLLQQRGGRAEPRTAHAWLGEPVAIKDPTAAVFVPQSGNNLLLVGQNEQAAAGVLSAAVVSLAAQHPPVSEGLPRFLLLDGSPVVSPQGGVFAGLFSAVPHSAHLGGWRELAGVLRRVCEEIDRRTTSPDEPAPFTYVLIFGLQRFRDLRLQEEDFGFSRTSDPDAPPAPAQQFRTLIKEGPGVDIFTLVWCDNVNNLNRSLDRQALREFDLRVVFQMSAADSGILIDSPLASRLGPYRALFASADFDQPEKFRPYDPPGAEALDAFAAKLRAKWQ